MAPIVVDSIDMSIAFRQSRYDRNSDQWAARMRETTSTAR
jgi:folate-dependent tRNA-U54 methylase TrmFO/GidA